VYKLLVTVPWVTFAFVFDAGPLRVREYESVVIGLGTRLEVVSEEQKASLLDSRPCGWLMVNSRCSHSYKNSTPCGQTEGGDRAPQL